MTIEQKKQIKDSILAEMNAKGLSQNAWADKKGISKSHMSNILNPEKWDSVGERTWNDLLNKVEAVVKGETIHNTTNIRMITNACMDAQRNKRVVGLTGYTGAGKTTGLKSFDSNNANTHYMVCRSSFGVKDMVFGIAAAMGVQSKGGRTLDMEDAIIEQMNNSTDTLLILDSVSKLRKDAALQFIGDLCEATEHKAGIIIAGTEFLHDYITKSVAKNKRGFREFNRRIYTWTQLPSFKSEKIQAEAVKICQENGIWLDAQIEKIVKNSTCFGSLYNGIDKMKKATNS